MECPHGRTSSSFQRSQEAISEDGYSLRCQLVRFLLLVSYLRNKPEGSCLTQFSSVALGTGKIIITSWISQRLVPLLTGIKFIMLGRSGFDCCFLPERVGGWLIKLISHFWNWMAFPSSNTSASNLELPVDSGSVLSGEKQGSEHTTAVAGTV